MAYAPDQFVSEPTHDGFATCYPTYISRVPKAVDAVNATLNDLNSLICREVGQLTHFEYRDDDMITDCDKAKMMLDDLCNRLNAMKMVIDAIKDAESNKMSPPEPWDMMTREEYEQSFNGAPENN